MPSMWQDRACRVDFARRKNSRNPMCSNPSPNEPPRVKIWIKRKTPIKGKQEHGFPSGNQERSIVQRLRNLKDIKVGNSAVPLQQDQNNCRSYKTWKYLSETHRLLHELFFFRIQSLKRTHIPKIPPMDAEKRKNRNSNGWSRGR